MSRRKVTHSEDWWLVHAPAHVLRCEGHYKTGEQCRREAIPGSNVCRTHGGASPHVMAAAAARIQNTADEAVKVLHAILTDPTADDRDKILVAKDFLDRAGLVPTNKVLLGVVTDDPVERLFRDLLADPAGLLDPGTTLYTPSAEVLALNRAQQVLDDGPDFADVVEAEVVEDDQATPLEDKPYEGGTPKHIREAMEALL
jgi:hypothetical protein